MKRSRTFVSLFFVVSAACSAPLGNVNGSVREASTRVAPASDAPAPPPTPTIDFNANWSIQQSSAVTSGGKAVIHYDIARLATCRATYMAFPAWDISANWNVDGGIGYNASVTVPNAGNTARVGQDITIDVPPGRTLNMWFVNSDESGCLAYDSNYGRNFSFELEPGPPTIRFPWPGFDATVVDTLRAGGPIEIDYDIRRLYECRGDNEGGTAWDVTAFYSFDGGAAQSQSLTTLSSSGRVQSAITFAAPAGAQSLAVWFENSDTAGGCSAWDSRYGNNYTFRLQ
jgi:hypothetical protein